MDKSDTQADFKKKEYRWDKKPPSNILQKVSIYSTILGAALTLILGIITLWLMIMYGENKDMIEKLVNISSKLEQQNQMTQKQISQLSSHTKIALEQGILIKTQLSIAEKQLSKVIMKDSIEKWANVIRFSDNYDQLITIASLIHDTTETRKWNNYKKYEILINLNKNLTEGLLNPILIEDKISFDEWNNIARQVGGILFTWPEQSQPIKFIIQGMSKEELEEFNDKVFIDIIKNCGSASKVLFKRIICKYKYNAAC